MGIKCQIHLNSPSRDVYRPGCVLRGIVRYSMNEDIKFEDITLSFKGKSRVKWSRGSGKRRRVYRGSDDIIVNYGTIMKPGTNIVAAGTYESRFYLTLPQNLPPSYKDRHCTIEYYLRIVFSRSGFMNFTKRFRKIITLGNTVTPTLPSRPLVYVLEKNLTTFFSSNTSCVKLKGTINNSFLRPGEAAQLTYEIENNTKHVIPTIKTKLISKVVYISNTGQTKTVLKKVKGSKCDTLSVEGRGKGHFTVSVDTPLHIHTIQHSRVFAREYYLLVLVKLPMPHRDARLGIPVQIGETLQAEPSVSNEILEDRREDQPPSYWEAIEEDKMHNSKEYDSD